MAPLRDYYKILQISSNADTAIIKAAYYTHLKTLKKHPDLGGTNEEAMLLNEAYEILSDPLRRKEYDEKFLQQTSQSKPQQEKRRVARIPLRQNCFFKHKNNKEWIEAQFRDISPLGACFRSLGEFKIGETIELDFSSDPKLKGYAIVRWVRTIPQRFGKPIYEGGAEFQGFDATQLHQFFKKVGLAVP